MSLEVYKVDRSTVGGINMLVYGQAGAGKTHFAASAQDVPEMADVLFLDVEGGLMTVAERGDVSAVKIESVDQLEEAFWALQQGKPGFDGFRTVVIDSISELYKRDSSARKKKYKDQRQAYGESGELIRNVVQMYKAYDELNVILLSQAKERYADDDTGQVVDVGPDVGPSLATSLMAAVDCVWYLYVRGKDHTRVMLTEPKGAFRAKTRGSAFAARLGAAVENPSMAQIHALYTGAEKVPA